MRKKPGWHHISCGLSLTMALFSACNTSTPQTPTGSTSVVATATLKATPTPTTTSMPTLTHATTPTERQAPHASPTIPVTMTPTTLPHPTIPGCLRPPDDYGRVEIDGETLNARTLWMLQQAQTLYDGPGDLLRVTQGGYTTGEKSSFGTHAGGGAVDISIRNPADPAEILWDETDMMVLALRRAGFAAWYRAPGDLGSGSPAHIHAIAIGDRELSEAAITQLTGPGGYFHGLDGLPPEYGGPHPDPHDGPVVCPWMIEMGYQDLRYESPE